MKSKDTTKKFKLWLRRYVVAELLGTVLSVGFASFIYVHSHSFIAAAGAGFLGEGIGFYGYFVSRELLTNSKSYRALPFFKRITTVLARSSTNLIVEFAPAGLIDSIFIRPFLMYAVPQHIKPYAVGFVIGKVAADLLFYVFAIAGFELKQRMHTKSPFSRTDS
jgi:hypothetical protein